MSLGKLRIRRVAIIGTGLLGGSLGLALKRADSTLTICGVGRRQSSLDDALDAGAIDQAFMDVAPAVIGSDLVVLATPVGAFGSFLTEIRPHLKRGAVVTDVGSTKSAVVASASRILGAAGPFVGSHPMAGSEQKGARFARAELFEGATCIVTPTLRTPPTATGRIERLWRLLGMKVVRMTPAGHDKAVAAISHLPHLLSAMMMLEPAQEDLEVSAGGFRDVTRLAGGDAEMWRDILLTNRKAILAAIDRFDESMAALRDLLELSDADGIEQFLAEARWRRQKYLGNPNGTGE